MLDLNKCYNMDCLDGLKKLDDNSVDLIVTDPPYFLINDSGNGFMGKNWDSVSLKDGDDQLLKSKKFVDFVENFFLLMKVESNTEEENIVHQSVKTETLNQTQIKKSHLNVNIVEKNTKDLKQQSKMDINYVHSIVFTKEEVLDSLKGLSKNHIIALESLPDNASFAVPISHIVISLKHIVQENVLKLPTRKICVEKKTQLTLMEEVKINAVIEGMIGRKSEKLFTNEMDTNVNNVESIVKNEKYNAIILKHTEFHKIMGWIIWLLFVIYVIQKSNGVEKYLTKKDLIYELMGIFHENWLEECLRILKPGAFAFIMSAPRQDVLSRTIMNIGNVGFKTGFTSIYWSYFVGFPKAMNISKAVEKKLGKDAPEVKMVAGTYSGFNPKPAVEVVLVAMKPLSEKSYTNQVLANGHGVTHLDDCRIPFQSEEDKESSRFGVQTDIKGGGYGTKRPSDGDVMATNVLSSETGRFPANLLVCDDVLNDGKMHPSGDLTGQKGTPNNVYGTFDRNTPMYLKGNSVDSPSRYFDLDAWWDERLKTLDPVALKTFPFLLVPKGSVREKSMGLEDVEAQYMDQGRKVGSPGGTNPRNRGAQNARKNFHPTVKPVKLFTYLITLGSRKGDIIVDPFGGSGTTGVSAEITERDYILFEMEEDFHEIACKRIEYQQTITKKEKDNKLSNFFKMKC